MILFFLWPFGRSRRTQPLSAVSIGQHAFLHIRDAFLHISVNLGDVNGGVTAQVVPGLPITEVSDDFFLDGEPARAR